MPKYPDPIKLSILVKRATLPEYRMRDITGDGIAETFCNRFVDSVAFGLGCTALRSKLGALSANQQHTVMLNSPDFTNLGEGWKVAQAWTNLGYLVIYSRQASGHGHLCVGSPGEMSPSGAWGMDVPNVANVGKETSSRRNFSADKLSYAFRSEQKPVAFAWRGPSKLEKEIQNV